MIEISIGLVAVIVLAFAGRTIKRQKSEIADLQAEKKTVDDLLTQKNDALIERNKEIINLKDKIRSQDSKEDILKSKLEAADAKLAQTERWYQWARSNLPFIDDKIDELPEWVVVQRNRGGQSIEYWVNFMDRVEPILKEKRDDWRQESINRADADSKKAKIEQKVLLEAIRDLGRLVAYLLRTTDDLSDMTKAHRDCSALAMLTNLADLSTVGLVEDEEPWGVLLRGSNNGLDRSVIPFNLRSLHELLVDLRTHRPVELMAIIDSMPQTARNAMMRLTIAMPPKAEQPAA